jgi:hypothetical protein
MHNPALRIALTHATALAVDPIAAAFVRRWQQVRRMNLLDDSLSVDRAQVGSITHDLATAKRVLLTRDGAALEGIGGHG